MVSEGPADTPASAAAGNGRRSVVQSSAALLALALASDDAEEAGVRAADVLADPEGAVDLLGRPDAVSSARHAVVQRYGRVGALLVIGFEDRWRRRRASATAPAAAAGRGAPPLALLEELVEGFSRLDAPAMDELLAALDEAEGMPVVGESATARRWLHATYAVAARDGTDASHRAYMTALDRVMRLAAPRIAS